MKEVNKFPLVELSSMVQNRLTNKPHLVTIQIETNC